MTREEIARVVASKDRTALIALARGIGEPWGDAIAVMLEADGKLREVIKAELDESTHDRSAVGSLTAIVRAAALWPKGEAVPPVTLFHDHLDACRQCAGNPFDLCATGNQLLRNAGGQ